MYDDMLVSEGEKSKIWIDLAIDSRMPRGEDNYSLSLFDSSVPSKLGSEGDYQRTRALLQFSCF